MILKMYAIYDKLAEQYAAPFYQLNDQTAIRFFKHAVLANENAEPSDFELYALGSYNVGDASFVILPKPSLIDKGSRYEDGE